MEERTRRRLGRVAAKDGGGGARRADALRRWRARRGGAGPFRHGAQAAIARGGAGGLAACPRSHAGQRVLGAALAAALALGLAGCSAGPAADASASGGEPAASEAPASAEAAALADVGAMDFEYSKRDGDASYDATSVTAVDLSAGTVEGPGAAFDAATGTLAINAAGTYVVTGSLDQGQIVVEADKDADKVQVVLAGASVRNESGPALYVKSADKVFVTLADGTRNVLADGASYELAEGEDEPNGAVFSKGDLTFNGTGSLAVEGSYRHGIVSKDDLVVAGGTYEVTAAEDGLRGRDCVKVADGDITVTAGGDAVKSNNDEDPARGFVTLDGGTLDLTAGDDGVDAYTLFRVTGGTVTIDAADDAFRSEVLGRIAGGTLSVRAGDDAFHTEYELVVDDGQVDVAACYEGYESEKVYVNGGATRIVASDDAVNASTAEDPTAAEGEGEGAGAGATAGAPAEGAPAGDAPSGGAGNPGTAPAPAPGSDEASPEGGRPSWRDAAPGEDGSSASPADASAEGGTPPALPEGTEPPAAPQDAPNGASAEGAPSAERPGGAPDGGGGRGGFGPGGGALPGASEECLIQVNGGSLVIVAGGDGIDSNGSVEVNGGTVLVTGPMGGADSVLDYELEATVNGGTVIMVGSAGMAMGFTGGTQPSALVAASGAAGDAVSLVDEAGVVLASFTAEAAFQSVVVSSPDLADGATCQVVVGGMLVGAVPEGALWRGGSVDGGSAVSATVSTEGSSRLEGAGGRGGFGGFDRGGDRPDGKGGVTA